MFCLEPLTCGFLIPERNPDAPPCLSAYALQRAVELCGLGALLALLGWNVPDTVLGHSIQGLSAVCALLALLLKDRGVVPVIAMIVATVSALSA